MRMLMLHCSRNSKSGQSGCKIPCALPSPALQFLEQCSINIRIERTLYAALSWTSQASEQMFYYPAQAGEAVEEAEATSGMKGVGRSDRSVQTFHAGVDPLIGQQQRCAQVPAWRD